MLFTVLLTSEYYQYGSTSGWLAKCDVSKNIVVSHSSNVKCQVSCAQSTIKRGWGYAVQRGNNRIIPQTQQPSCQSACINTGDEIRCCGGLNRDICSFVKVSALSLSCPLFSRLWVVGWVLTRCRIMLVCFADGEGSLPYSRPNMTDDDKKINCCQNCIGFSGFVVKVKRIYEA